MWDDIIYPYRNFNGYTVQAWECVCMWLFIHKEIIGNPY